MTVEPGEMERLGETDVFGDLLLRLVRLAGWEVDERPLLGGGVLLIATGFGTAVAAADDTYAGASHALLDRVMALKKWRDKAAA